LGGFEYGIVDMEMTGGGYICVPDTHMGASDFGTLLVFAGGDFGPERGSKQGAGWSDF
jgi:hypothetical protein